MGIYKIENKVNGKVYVGQSVNIELRWGNHKSELKHNNHNNKYLQRAWNKYGSENFEFTVLEECELRELNSKEIFWIEYFDSYNSGYNATLGGEGTQMISENTIQKIYELYSSGDYIPREIGEMLGVDRRTVERYLNNGTELGICDYNGSLSRLNCHVKKVICLNTLEIFESVKEAQDKYKVYGIASCCKHKHKYAGTNIDGEPLLWMHLDEYILYSEAEINDYINNIRLEIYSKYVVCLNTLQIFESTRKACDWCGLKQVRSIQLCCTNNANYAGKHPITGEKLRWMYYENYIKENEKSTLSLLKSA